MRRQRGEFAQQQDRARREYIQREQFYSERQSGAFEDEDDEDEFDDEGLLDDDSESRQALQSASTYQLGRDLGWNVWNRSDDNLTVCISENAECGPHESAIPFTSPEERELFEGGFRSVASHVFPKRATVRKWLANAPVAAEAAGYELSEQVSLFDQRIFKGVKFDSRVYATSIRSSIDRNSGELLVEWDEPFQTEALNHAFSRGVQRRLSEENAEQRRKERLVARVPVIASEDPEDPTVQTTERDEGGRGVVFYGRVVFGLLVVGLGILRISGGEVLKGSGMVGLGICVVFFPAVKRALDGNT
jgi:hypothetical protein